MNEIKLKGRIASLHTDGNPDLAEILLTPQELIQQLPLSDMTLYGYSLAELAKIIDFAKSRGFDPKESEPKQETKFNPQSMDEKDWAKEFMRIYKYNQVKNVEFIDEDFMLGWFANAIMAGFDEANRRKPKQEKKAECEHSYPQIGHSGNFSDICSKCGELFKQKKIEKIDYDKLDIARIDPNKRQFVQAIQIAINNLRSKSNELIDAIEKLREVR